MITTMVWMLISVGNPSTTNAGAGVSTVIGHFKTQEMCQHVLNNLPTKRNVSARCIQAEIIK